jgi:hypothetical protein
VIFTAVLLVSVSPRAPTQPLSTCAARAPLAHCVAHSIPVLTAIDISDGHAAVVAVSPPASAAVESHDESALSPWEKTPAQSTAASTVQHGSRVRIAGLHANPHYNGRTGAVCSGFDQESGRWTVAVDASDAEPAFQIEISPANLTLLPDIDLPQLPSAPLVAANMNTPPVPAVQDGSRVCVAGLQAAPQMNGRTGVVRGAFDQQTGRWTVDLAADGTGPACCGTFRPANLRLIPSHNFRTEWVDEGGRVWPKNVDFSRQCAKGHALAPLGDRGGLTGVQLMCRLCHCFCGCGCEEASSWLVCSEDAACCGEYAVCCSCSRSPSAAAAACSDSDDFHTLVRHGVAMLRDVTANATPCSVG